MKMSQETEIGSNLGEGMMEEMEHMMESEAGENKVMGDIGSAEMENQEK